jgi:hypothetical protein
MLRLQLSVFKVRSWVAVWPEAVRFSGGTVGLRRCGRRVMIGGAHLSARRGAGQRRLEAVALSYDGGRNWAGHRRSMRAY